MFRGIFIPVVTPFRDGAIDWDSLERVVEYYVNERVDGLIPCGTTGESPTLSETEHKEVVEFVVEKTAKRTAVIAGTGSNETTKAIEFTQHAEAVGADGALVVCPYYNKPTQPGILAHYRALAAETGLPIIVYNIPGRTGRNIETDTLLELAEIENIVGVKEASGSIAQLMEVNARRPEGFSVLSGEDDLIFVNCCLGGGGAIAASAHILPAEWMRMCRAIWEGDLDTARTIHTMLLPLVRILFAETNPSPVKTALYMMNLIASDEVRLPLVPTSGALRPKLELDMRRLALID